MIKIPPQKIRHLDKLQFFVFNAHTYVWECKDLALTDLKTVIRFCRKQSQALNTLSCQNLKYYIYVPLLYKKLNISQYFILIN
jgi:hypothetical protein